MVINMRQIILNLTMSLDGYIIDETGSFDWIVGDGDKHLNTDKVFNFETFMSSIDTVVMGSKSFKDCDRNMLKNKKIIVATSKNYKDSENINFINGDVVGYIKKLQKTEVKDIWLYGGGNIVNQFLKVDCVNQFIIGVIPIILGSGTLLFSSGNPTIKLHLDSYTVDEGIPILIYSKRTS